MSNGVTDKDLGYQAFIRFLGEAEGAVVTVGVQQEEGAVRPEGSRATVAEYATFNEFGTKNVPERSFLRSTADAKRDEWGKALSDELTGTLDKLAGAAAGRLGSIPGLQAELRRGLGRVGLRAARDVQLTIRDLRTPPNAPYTIKMKKSSNPLIANGRLYASIRHKVVKP